MNIFYFMIESKPLQSNPESVDYVGAYINCWVRSEKEENALKIAKDYIIDQGWELICIEDIFIASREQYLDDQDTLKCFDQAVASGVGAIFYTWTSGDED